VISSASRAGCGLVGQPLLTSGATERSSIRRLVPSDAGGGASISLLAGGGWRGGEVACSQLRRGLGDASATLRRSPRTGARRSGLKVPLKAITSPRGRFRAGLALSRSPLTRAAAPSGSTRGQLDQSTMRPPPPSSIQATGEKRR